VNAEFSSDGRWLAYDSTEPGGRHVFVRPFPATDKGRWQVSTAGGVMPVWTRNGRELLYVSPQNDLVSVAIRPGDQFQFGSPAVVLKNVINPDVSVGRSYDVAPDGQRFLFIRDKSEADAANRDLAIGIVLNWQQGLKARLPSDK